MTFQKLSFSGTQTVRMQRLSTGKQKSLLARKELETPVQVHGLLNYIRYPVEAICWFMLE